MKIAKDGKEDVFPRKRVSIFLFEEGEVGILLRIGHISEGYLVELM
jgi:hypothetical protein